MRIEPAPSEPSAAPTRPGGDRGAAAAAGAAGGALQIPGVARGAERGCLGERPDAQLGHVGLADHDRAGLAQAAHDLGVGARPGRRARWCRSAVTSPATSMSSLTAIGTPSSGRPPPAPRRASAWSASISARSAKTTRKRSAARRSARSASGTARPARVRSTSPAAISAAWLGDAGECEIGGIHCLESSAVRPWRPCGRSTWLGGSHPLYRAGLAGASPP